MKQGGEYTICWEGVLPDVELTQKHHKAETKVLILQELESKLQNRDTLIAQIVPENIELKKRTWGPLTGKWVEPEEVREEIISYIL